MSAADVPDATGVRVERLAPERWNDFLAVHSAEQGAGWCRCVAWWVPTWEGWGTRSAEQNLALRRALCARGEHDGYLAYRGARAIGWCQVGPRDRLSKLVAQYGLEPDGAAWAVTCFQVDPAERRRGVAAALLRGALEDLRRRGVRRVQAFPRRAGDGSDGALWTGPEALYRAAGFRVARDDAERPVLELRLA